MNEKSRQQRMEDRARRGAQNKGKKGLGKKTVLDFSVVGDRDITRFEMRGGMDNNRVVIKNAIDILPFEISKDWYQDMREPTGAPNGLQPGDTDYKLEYAVHRNMGDNEDTLLCLKKTFGHKCPMCEELQNYYDIPKDKRTKRDDAMIKFLFASWRCTYNVYNYDDPDSGIHLWVDQSYKLFEEQLQEELQTDPDGLPAFSSLENGFTIVFRGKEKSLDKSNFYEATSFDFEERGQPWPADTLDQTFPLDKMLKICTYDESAHIFLQIDGPPDYDKKNKEDGGSGGDGDQSRSRGGDTDDRSSGDTPRDRDRGRSSGRDRGNTRDRGDTGGDRDRTRDTADENPCPANGIMGKEHRDYDECNKCDENIYQECADMSESGGGGDTDKPDDTPWDKDQPQDRSRQRDTGSRDRGTGSRERSTGTERSRGGNRERTTRERTTHTQRSRG